MCRVLCLIAISARKIPQSVNSVRVGTDSIQTKGRTVTCASTAAIFVILIEKPAPNVKTDS